MTQTMRERLADVAERAVTFDPFEDDCVTNWPDVIDAILAEMGDAEANALDAARYRYLRGDGRDVLQPAYEPEEEHVWGGADLDALCDAGIAAMIDAVREGK